MRAHEYRLRSALYIEWFDAITFVYISRMLKLRTFPIGN